MRDMMQHGAFKLLSGQLAASGLRFCPIKGADLAWRAYPDGALRPKVDLDILVHPDDLTAAYNVAVGAGWQTKYEYHGERHLPPLHRNSVVLELHGSLPDFEECSSADIWKYVKAEDGGRHRLSKELNIAMLVNHAARDLWVDGVKLLLDLGFLLQAEGLEVDWKGMAAMVEDLKIPVTPAWVFCGFPEFFPPESRIGLEIDDRKGLEAVRQLVLVDALKGYGPAEDAVMNDAARFSRRWWKRRLYGLSPAAIRYKTNNPRGHYMRLLWGYAADVVRKIWVIIRLSGKWDNPRMARVNYLRRRWR